jgi:hypothetical protein
MSQLDGSANQSIEIARMLPDPAMREKVLASTRDFLLRSF